MLPDSVARDPERIARLRREAQTLAALNDPHIAAIFGFEASGGIHALVMELVEGRTLADVIADGPLPTAQALNIAGQIASGLEAAHALGIVHRDLKPANVKVRPDGTVKVLDFGLARIQEASGIATIADAATLTSPALLTAAGVVLGTSAYMAPEQARGDAADTRSDVWAFGCVLYEMLTGRRAFAGHSVTETLASVLRSEPDWNALPGDVPTATRVLLERCLRKDRAQRIQAISTARFVIAEQDTLSAVAAPDLRPRGGRTVGALIAAAALIGLAGGAVAMSLLQPAPAAPVARIERFDLAPSVGAAFAAEAPGVNVAISPDGSRIVYTASRNGVSQLVQRPIDRVSAMPIAGTDSGLEPFFSPDGTQIGFVTSGEIKRVAIEGGSAATIWRGNPTFGGGSWGADGFIVFSHDSGLFRVAAAGGEPVSIAQPDAAHDELHYDRPVRLPDGNGIVYTVTLRNGQTRVATCTLSGTDPRVIVERGFGAQYLPEGYLVYGQDDRLMAVRFDPVTRRTSGTAIAIEDGVFTKAAEATANVAIAADGTAVFVAGQNAGLLGRLVWFDRLGRRGAVALDTPLDTPRNVRLSPDGRRVALTTGPPGQHWDAELNARLRK